MSKLKTTSLFILLIFLVSCNHSEDKKTQALQKEFKKLEMSSQGRLGVFAINLDTKQTVSFQAQDRFPLSSTFKSVLVGAILKKSMSDPAFLNKKVSYTKQDIENSAYAPITKKYTSMTIKDLCKAAITYSDNMAANVLLKEFGNPDKFTEFVHDLGFKDFQMNRFEPDLNEALPQDKRDTSTPFMMVHILQQFLFGNVLGESEQTLLKNWLKANTTGDTRIKAGLPSNWVSGDKTGTGSYGTTNDIAVVWNDKNHRLIFAIYFTQGTKNAPYKDDVLVKTTKLLVDYFK